MALSFNFDDFVFVDAPLRGFNSYYINTLNEITQKTAGGAGYVSGLAPYLPNKVAYCSFNDPNVKYNGGSLNNSRAAEAFIKKGSGTHNANSSFSLAAGLLPWDRFNNAVIAPYEPKSPVWFFTYSKVKDVVDLTKFKGYAAYLPINLSSTDSNRLNVYDNRIGAKVKFHTVSGYTSIPELQDSPIEDIGEYIIINYLRLYDTADGDLPRTGASTSIMPTVFLSGNSAAIPYNGNIQYVYEVQGAMPLMTARYFERANLSSVYKSALGSPSYTPAFGDKIIGKRLKDSGGGVFGVYNSWTSVGGLSGYGRNVIFIDETNPIFTSGKTINSNYLTLLNGTGIFIVPVDWWGTTYSSVYWVFKDVAEFMAMCKDWGIIATDSEDIAKNYPLDYIPNDTDAFVPDGGKDEGYDTNPTPTPPAYPDNTSDIIPETVPTVTPLSALNLYALNLSNVKAFLNWLLTSDYTQNISELFSDKLSAIGDLKLLPFDVVAHDPAHTVPSNTLNVANVVGNVGNSKIIENYNCWVNGGSIQYTAYYGDSNDYLNCSYSVYIPYVGITDLSPSDIVNKTLTLKYAVDINTGNATAVIYSNGVVIKLLPCSMGISIPITSTNSNQRQINSALTNMSAIAGLINGVGASISSRSPTPLIGAGLNAAQKAITTEMTNPLITSHNGAVGNCTGLELPQYAFLIITRHKVAIPTGYQKLVGRPTTYYGTIAEFVGSGFVSVDADKINIVCTAVEREKILETLKGGIYI